jgi:hypothetical protein
MMTAAPPMPSGVQLAKVTTGFPQWLLTHRGAAAMAGLLALAGPLTFFTGALSVMRSPTPVDLARLGVWWTLYGFSLWAVLLLAGYACERLAGAFGPYVRAGTWLVAALSAAAFPNILTAGRATLLMEQGLVHSAGTMQLHGFTVSLVMALLYFAHLRRSHEHERATARLAAAQAAQRYARRRIVEERLQELQARVDPQILFEMLDVLRRLYERDATQAEQFLDELIAFLRAALPRLRATSSSLLREVELARAFVRLHAQAGAHELDLVADVAPNALHARFPPGVLLPLLDNAVTGSTARLSARREGDACRLVFALGAPPSERAAARVRALLSEIYGAAATLAMESDANASRVSVKVPYELA